MDPTTEGIIAAFLPGRTVGVQLYGDELNIPLINFLARAGAEADPVAPYATNVDDGRVADQIERIGAGALDVIISGLKWSIDRSRRLVRSIAQIAATLRSSRARSPGAPTRPWRASAIGRAAGG